MELLCKKIFELVLVLSFYFFNLLVISILSEKGNMVKLVRLIINLHNYAL